MNAWKPASGRLVDDSTASDTAFLVVGSCRSREDLRGQGEGGSLQPSSSSTHDDYRTPISSAPEIPSATAGWSARHLARSLAGAIARGMVPAALSKGLKAPISYFSRRHTPRCGISFDIRCGIKINDYGLTSDRHASGTPWTRYCCGLSQMMYACPRTMLCARLCPMMSTPRSLSGACTPSPYDVYSYTPYLCLHAFAL